MASRWDENHIHVKYTSRAFSDLKTFNANLSHRMNLVGSTPPSCSIHFEFSFPLLLLPNNQIDSTAGPFQSSRLQEHETTRHYTNFTVKMGSKYESKLTAAQWATFADTIIANVRARYTLSAGDEEEVRYQVLGRVQRDPAGWAPSNYNPYQQCLEDLKAIAKWKTDAASGHTWRDHMAAAPDRTLPPQFPLRAAMLASIGVLRNSQTRAYREASTKFDDLIRQVGVEFVVQGRAPNGFWAGLDMEVDFNKRPADRAAKKHDLPRRPRYFMTRQQGIAHRNHVASTTKWLDPTRAPEPNPYLSPRASQGAAPAQMSSGLTVPSGSASASASVPAPTPVTGVAGSKIPVLKRTAGQREDSTSPERPPPKASRPDLKPGHKVHSASASLLPRPSQQKKSVASAEAKHSPPMPKVQSKIGSKDKNREEKAAAKHKSKEDVTKKVPVTDDLGGRAQDDAKTKKPVAEPEKTSSAQESKSGRSKDQAGEKEKSRKVHFDPKVKVKVLPPREETPKKREDRDMEHPAGSQFYIPPYRKSSAAAKNSKAADEKAGAASISGTLSPVHKDAPEKPMGSVEAPKAISNEGLGSLLAGSEAIESPGVSSGPDVHNETGEGLEDAKDKQMGPDQAQGDGPVQMPPLTWLDVLKPGNKLSNGVVIWDVRLLTGEWEQDDFLDFLFVVDDVYWSVSEWALQKSYFVQLAKAYPVGPKKLAKLVNDWDITRAEDMEVDLVNDHPVSLAEKTYTRVMGEVYSEAEKKEFRAALGRRE